MNRTKRFSTASLIVVITAALALVTGGFGLASADEVVVDFEGLSEGQVVVTLSSGNGVSGPPVPGDISVSTDSNGSVDAAIIFDATCEGDQALCSGDDPDLYQPAQGNVLIIAENNDFSDPDDETLGGTISFDFSNFTFDAPGTGTVTAINVQILDVEEAGGEIRLYDSSNNLISTLAIPVVGDGDIELLDLLNTAGVASMQVQFAGSGATDDWRLFVQDPPPQVTPTTPPPTQPPATPTEPPDDDVPPPTPTPPPPTATPVPPTPVAEVQAEVSEVESIFSPPQTGDGGLVGH